MSELNEFIDGQYACYKGWDCPADASEAFVRGFGAQYELEQVKTHRSEHVNHRAA